MESGRRETRYLVVSHPRDRVRSLLSSEKRSSLLTCSFLSQSRSDGLGHPISHPKRRGRLARRAAPGPNLPHRHEHVRASNPQLSPIGRGRLDFWLRPGGFSGSPVHHRDDGIEVRCGELAATVGCFLVPSGVQHVPVDPCNCPSDDAYPKALHVYGSMSAVQVTPRGCPLNHSIECLHPVSLHRLGSAHSNV